MVAHAFPRATPDGMPRGLLRQVAVDPLRAVQEMPQADRHARAFLTIMRMPDYKKRIDGRRGTWTQTAAGTRFFPLDPRPEDFDPAVIAEQLAKHARFAGSTPGRFYSVAEHCILVAEQSPSFARQEALLH